MASVTIAPPGVDYKDLTVNDRQVAPGAPSITGEHGVFSRSSASSVSYAPTDKAFTGTDYCYVSLLGIDGAEVLLLTLVASATDGVVRTAADWTALRQPFVAATVTSTQVNLTVLNAATDMSTWTLVAEVLNDGGTSVAASEFSYAQFSAGAVTIALPNGFEDLGESTIKLSFRAASGAVGGRITNVLRYLSAPTFPVYASEITSTSAKLVWRFAGRIPTVTQQRVTISGSSSGWEPVTDGKTVTVTSGFSRADIEFADASNNVVHSVTLPLNVP